MRHTRLLALLATTAAVAVPRAAEAAVFPSDVIDGPTGEILSAGDLDIARDGTGAVAYVKRDGGVPHVFVSRLVGGAFAAPERLDTALPAPGSQPVVAAADGGRLAVAFVSGTQLVVSVRPDAGTGFQAPQPISDGASNPSIDMSVSGVAYLSFTASGQSAADVRVARLARRTSTFALLPDVLDIAPAREAGDGVRRSRVAASADGTGIVIWGEADHVYVRRVFGARISAAPLDLNAASVEGHAGGAADSPEIDIEDDSSYAWAVVRQTFDDGRVHAVATRLRGSGLDTPVFVDGLGFPAPGDATETAFDLSGRGVGIAATSGAGGVNGAVLHDDVFNRGAPLGAGTATSRPSVGIAENNEAYVAWQPGDGTSVIRSYDIDRAKRSIPPPGPVSTLSRPELGPVVAAAGMDLAVNRAGDAAAVFVQEAADGRRLVAGVFDRVPGAFSGSTSSKYRSLSRPPLAWSAAFELWGPLTYRVEVDGQPVGQTGDTRIALVNPIPDGVHSWRVVATDRRGQTAVTKTRTLRIDTLPPALTFRVTGTRKRGRPIKVAVTTADGSLTAPAGSGVATTRIDWGDRTRRDTTRTATHRYGRSGTFTVRVSATDKAGNAVALTRRITVKR